MIQDVTSVSSCCKSQQIYFIVIVNMKRGQPTKMNCIDMQISSKCIINLIYPECISSAVILLHMNVIVFFFRYNLICNIRELENFHKKCYLSLLARPIVAN